MTRQYQRTDTRRRALAQAALEVIAEHGLARFTTRAIAAKVGIADGTIFRHFRNKSEIVIAALDFLEEEIFAESFEGPEPKASLKEFFAFRGTMVGSNRASGRLYYSEQLPHAVGDEGRAKFVSWNNRDAEYVIGKLTAMKEAGALNADLTPEQGFELVRAHLLSISFSYILDGEISETGLENRIAASWTSLGTVLFN